jgi:hypothetical protein
MPEWDDHGNHGGVKLAHRASIPAAKPRSFARAERWHRPADQLDDMIRRWVIGSLWDYGPSHRIPLYRAVGLSTPHKSDAEQASLSLSNETRKR